MKTVGPAADGHGQPAVVLARDQAPRHREGVEERGQRCAQRAGHFGAGGSPVRIVQSFLAVGLHPCLMPSNSRRWRSAFSLVVWRE